MSSSISFFKAVLININLVIGCAFFLGSAMIARQAGVYAPLAWLLCALLLLPVVIIFSRFARELPQAGGIYVYSRIHLGAMWGFISAWSYFIGTAAGNVVVLRAFTQYLSHIGIVADFLACCHLPTMVLDVACVLLFAGISLCNIQIFARLQALFSLIKIIPFAALLIGLYFLADPVNLVPQAVTLQAFTGAIPLALFAFVGIEACSAVIDKVEGAARNGFKVILISFAAIAGIYVVAQTLVVAIFGMQDVNPFLSILERLGFNPFVAQLGNKIIYGAMLMSFLGGYYAMFYFNNWNLYAIAADRQIWAGRQLARLNIHQSPPWCIVVQTAIILLFLITSQQQEYLVALGDAGIVIAFCSTAIAFLARGISILGLAGVFGCLVFSFFCLQDFLQASFGGALPLFTVVISGLALFLMRDK